MITLTKRRHQIWNGVNISPEKTMVYRRKWAKADGITLREAYDLNPWPGDAPPEDPPATCKDQAAALQSKLKRVADANKKTFANVPGKTRKVREKLTVKKRIDEYEGGPGTKFKELTNEFRAKENVSCDCESLKVRMNQLGLEGCQRERESLLEGLRKNYATLTVWDKAKALFTGGIPSWLNPRDPVSGMFDEALRRSGLISYLLRNHIKDMKNLGQHSFVLSY